MPTTIAIIATILLILAVAYIVTLTLNRSNDRLRYVERVAETEQKLSDLNSDVLLYQSALDQIEECVLYLDGRRRIKYLNRAARELVGPQEGRMLIEAVRDYELDDLFRRSIAQAEDQSAIIHLSWPPRLVGASVKLLGPAGIVLVLSDKTELENLQRVRRELIANVSHELRTPIATLQLLIDTLLEGAADDSEARAHFLNQLKEQTTHLGDIVRQSLYLASLESGGMESQLGPVAVTDIVEAGVSRLTPAAQRKMVNLVTDIEPGLSPVRADLDQMTRVMANLLENAIKWTPPHGTIRIISARDGEYVRFGVTDTGPGIPPEVLPRIFERFYKADMARSDEGTGLGLAIAKHTVLSHGGRIWAESVEGEGASVYFTLHAA